MTFIADNVELIRQGLSLLEDVDGDLYAKREPAISSSAIGSHLRHVADYYQRFLVGLEDGSIDYDLRERDERVELDRRTGVDRLLRLIAELEALRDRDVAPSLRVKVDAADESSWSASSLGRELQFLRSHTVHHFALIAVILRLNGIEPGDEFGVAPSTLRYWKENGVCAR
jgi:uncharacterized damage-inducible protein DinB